MDAVARGTASNRVGVACVDAEFVVEDGAANACGRKGIPVLVDDRGKTVAKGSVEGVGKPDNFVKFSLVGSWVPEDAVGAFDGEVEGVGGLAEDGRMTIAGEQVEIFVDIVGGWIRYKITVGRFGPPYFGGNVDDEGKSGRGQPCNGRRLCRRAYGKSEWRRWRWLNFSVNATREWSIVLAVSCKFDVLVGELVRVSQAGRLSMWGRAAGVTVGLVIVEAALEGGCRVMGKVVWRLRARKVLEAQSIRP